MLGPDVCHTWTVVDNAEVNRFLKYFGLESRGVLPEKVNVGATLHETLEYCLARATWFERGDPLQATAASPTRLLGGRATSYPGDGRR